MTGARLQSDLPWQSEDSTLSLPETLITVPHWLLDDGYC